MYALVAMMSVYYHRVWNKTETWWQEHAYIYSSK